MFNSKVFYKPWGKQDTHCLDPALNIWMTNGEFLPSTICTLQMDRLV